MKKKSYNPFKMWGSWIGMLFGIIVAFIFRPDCGIENYGCIIIIYTLPIGLMVGFLSGWVIHSLIRKLMN